MGPPAGSNLQNLAKAKAASRPSNGCPALTTHGGNKGHAPVLASQPRAATRASTRIRPYSRRDVRARPLSARARARARSGRRSSMRARAAGGGRRAAGDGRREAVGCWRSVDGWCGMKLLATQPITRFASHGDQISQHPVTLKAKP
jgi:hypothetical protein